MEPLPAANLPSSVKFQLGFSQISPKRWICNWLLVEPTHFKHMSQNGNLPQIPDSPLKHIRSAFLVWNKFSETSVLTSSKTPSLKLIHRKSTNKKHDVSSGEGRGWLTYTQGIGDVPTSWLEGQISTQPSELQAQKTSWQLAEGYTKESWGTSYSPKLCCRNKRWATNKKPVGFPLYWLVHRGLDDGSSQSP